MKSNKAASHGGLPGGAQSVDLKEVERFDALAFTWWDMEGPFWPLHRLNALRTDYLRELLSRRFGRSPLQPHPLTGLQVLDVGCGGGILSESMARLGATVKGIDVVQRSIRIAQEHADESGLEIEYETIEPGALLKAGELFDVVLNMEVVEHVPDVTTFLSDCAALVKPGGAMVLATINRTAVAWLFAIVGAEYLLRWLQRGTHRWSRFVTPLEVATALAQSNLFVESRAGVRVNPFNRNFSLTNKLLVNYMLIAGRQSSRVTCSEN